MPAPRSAFTILEICLVLLIGMVLIMLAVPSIADMLAEQRLHETWERFERLVNTARLESIQEQQPYRLGPDGDPVALGLSPAQFEQLRPLVSMLDATLEIRSIGHSGATMRTIEVIARKAGAKPQILSRKE